MFHFNITEIVKKLSNILVIYVELHSKDQSRMNQGWSYHDLYFVKIDTTEQYYLEPTKIRKINTKNYNCDEESDVKQNTCLNHFYMSKLNCTFPWLESHSSEIRGL